MNWLFVRTVAELRILTRASYITLIAVPVLVGLWPAVRMIVNQYNHIAKESSFQIEQAAEYLRAEKEYLEAAIEKSGTLTTSSVLVSSDLKADVETSVNALLKKSIEIESILSSILADLTPRTLTSPLLPWSVAVAFFAALNVFLAHLIYESRAPSTIRSSSQPDFVQIRLQEYREHPTVGKMRQALSFVEGSAFDSEHEYTSGVMGDNVLSPDNFACIEEGAQLEYINTARRNRISAAIALFFYGVGLTLLFLIIAKQSYSVAKAAGWVEWIIP